MNIYLLTRKLCAIFIPLAIIMALALVLLTNMNASANTVTINDQAGVLDQGKVQSEAAKLSVPVLIYTTKTFSGDSDTFQQQTHSMLPDQHFLAIGVDTVHRFFAVEGGSNVRLSDDQANNALQAFKSNYNGGDYTGAMIAAIDSVRDSLSGGSGSGIIPIGIITAIILGVGILVVIILVVVVTRRRRRGGPGSPRRSDSGYYSYPGYYGGGNAGNYGGGAGGSFGGSSFGGGAGGSFGGGSSGGGAGGSF